MKHRTVRTFLFLLLILLGCKEGSDPEPVQDEPWQQLADFPKEGRSIGVGFSISNTPYIGMARGVDTVYNSFWKFDTNQNQWKQISTPPTSTSGSLGFALNGKGYFLSNYINLIPGFQGTTDFWEYDPASDSWTKKKPYTGELSMLGSSFAINNKGYIFVGANFNSNDEKAALWEYSPGTDTWSEKAELPGGPARSSPAVFTLDNKAYIVGGGSYMEHPYNEVWVYDPSTNSWTEKNPFPGNGRVAMFGFSFSGKGYVGAGSKEVQGLVSNLVKEFWSYDPANDQWTKLEDYPGEGLYRPIVSYDDQYCYVLGGSVEDLHSKEFWRFNPDVTQ